MLDFKFNNVYCVVPFKIRIGLNYVQVILEIFISPGGKVYDQT